MQPHFDLLALHERCPARYPVLLESVDANGSLGRHDLLLALPGSQLRLGGDGTLQGDASVADPHGRFLDALDRWYEQEHAALPAQKDDPVFGGGWFLYLGYELAAEVEPTLQLPSSRWPRAVAWRMQGALLRDRERGTVSVLAETAALRARLQAQVETDCAALLSEAPHAAPELLATAVQESDPQPFLAGVQAVLDHIARGDVYQANLSRAWTARLAPGATACDLYRALRRANPAPFAGLVQFGDGTALLSSSPERLLQLRDGVASTRPIAGTRPRGHDAVADSALKRELQLNEKERAEHVMLVDLERNDLGRICRGGTVEVDEFMTIETYATVHHIVSNVRGELRPGVTPGQAIAAVFPGGTITGCPKVRCMQILAGLERHAREAYTGSIGYLAVSGDLDLNILIRTLTLRGDEIGFRTGAGIVADSQPGAELAETRAKAHGILRALGEPS